MRIGVLDIGSNTGHLLIVDAFRGGPPLPAHSFKEPLRLAEHLDAAGHVSEEGQARLVKYVVSAREEAEDRGCSRIVAFATSAVRDAGNSDAVLAAVAEASGVDVQVLPGDEEARLTVLAARRWFGWSSGRLGVLDIGGGSLELAVGSDEEPDVALSLPLGAVAADAAPDALPFTQKVLIVAAGPFEGRYLRDYFRALGGNVRVVSHGEAAITALSAKTPDLLILDAAFGPEEAKRIVAASTAAGCRRHLVLLSPFERRSFGAPNAAGFDRYLVKPVRRRSLEAQIRDWPEGAMREIAPVEDEPMQVEPLRNCRILIAEDNDINALLAGRLIERLGGRSVRASNGVEALELLRTSTTPGATPFDCALFDVRMPELDGLAAIQQWRAHEVAQGRAPIPALALTANAFREDREACLAAGFDGFLSKPLDREIFIRTIEKLLQPARQVA